MLIDNGNETFVAGQADVLCILKLPAGTYHAAFFEEHPLPGQYKSIEDEDVLRLKSKMHHTTGAKTLEDAKIHLAELRQKISLPDANVIDDKPVCVETPVNVWIVSNWLKLGKNVSEVLI